MAEEKRSRNGGETVREGVRSLVGVLGALKDALEQSFEDLRESVERKGERNPDAGTTGGPAGAPGPTPEEEAVSEAPDARDPVEAVRDRLDFATRKDIEAIRAALEAVEARVRVLEEAAGHEERAGTGAGPAPESGDAPEPPVERPFRIHSE